MQGLRSIPKIIKEKGFVIIFIEKIIPNSQISLHLFLGEYNVTVIGCRSMVRSMCVRKKAPPGWITEHAKFRRPANDYTSLLWPSFSQGSQKLGLCTVLFFFAGKRFSTWMVPNLIWAQRPTKRLNCCWHIACESAVIKNPVIKKVNEMIQGRI